MSTYREFVEKVRDASDILDVVRERIPMEGTQARCPFHPDDSPSLSVSPVKEVFRCFGGSCGAHGDVFAFVMQFDKVEFSEAVRRLAVRARLPLYRPLRHESAEQDAEAAVRAALTALVTAYHEALWATPEALAYVTQRRALPLIVVTEQQIGYARAGAAATALASVAPSVRTALVERGYVKEPRNPFAPDAAVEDRFEGRIIFPIFERGTCVFWTGRVLDDTSDAPKYLHPKGSPPLYNQDALLGTREIVVVEGAPDTLSFTAAGVPAVGLLGGRLSPAGAARLRLVPHVYLCTDPDEAGRVAALRAALALPQALIVPLTEGQDPNALLQTVGPEGFRAVLRGAVDPVRFFLDRIDPTVGDDLGALMIALEPVFTLLAARPLPRVEAALTVLKGRFALSREMLASIRHHVVEERRLPPAECPSCGTVLSYASRFGRHRR